jgi:hypothetical protein
MHVSMTANNARLTNVVGYQDDDVQLRPTPCAAVNDLKGWAMI